MQVEFSFRDKASNFKYQQPLTRLVRPLNNLNLSDYSEDTRNSLGITFGDKKKEFQKHSSGWGLLGLFYLLLSEGGP